MHVITQPKNRKILIAIIAITIGALIGAFTAHQVWEHNVDKQPIPAHSLAPAHAELTYSLLDPAQWKTSQTKITDVTCHWDFWSASFKCGMTLQPGVVWQIWERWQGVVGWTWAKAAAIAGGVCTYLSGGNVVLGGVCAAAGAAYGQWFEDTTRYSFDLRTCERISFTLYILNPFASHLSFTVDPNRYNYPRKGFRVSGPVYYWNGVPEYNYQTNFGDCVGDGNGDSIQP